MLEPDLLVPSSSARGPDPSDARLHEPQDGGFSHVVERRRSVRCFDSKIGVPDAVVRRCLRLAMLAPNSSNLQPWEFYWVRTLARREALVEACLSQPAARTAAELIVVVARTETWRTMRARMLEVLEKAGAPEAALNYYRRAVPLQYTQGWFGLLGLLKRVAVFAIGLTKPMPREPTSPAEMRIWAVKSTALAAQNLMLALCAFGFDSCAMEGFDSRRVRRVLRLPRDAEILLVLGIGKRAQSGVYGPQIRFEDSLFVHEV